MWENLLTATTFAWCHAYPPDALLAPRMMPSAFLQEDAGGRVAANCHHPEGFSSQARRCGGFLPPHSQVCLGLFLCFILPVTQRRSATCTGIFLAPGQPPSRCCQRGRLPHTQRCWSRHAQNRTWSCPISRPCLCFNAKPVAFW